MLINFGEMLKPSLPLAENLLRPAIVYVFLVIALRVAGKRLLAQLNPFDFVVLLILSNTVQNAIIGPDNSLSGGIIGACTLLVLNAGVVRLLAKHAPLESALEGRPDRLLIGGVIQRDVLRRAGVTETELRVAAHKQGFESLDEIQNAELDPGGVICFERRHATDNRAQHLAVVERLERIERLSRRAARRRRK